MPVGVTAYFKTKLLTSDVNYHEEDKVRSDFGIKHCNIVKVINPNDFHYLTDGKAGWYTYENVSFESDISYYDFEIFRRVIAYVLHGIPMNETFTRNSLRSIEGKDFYNIINTIDTRCYILGKPLERLKQDFKKHMNTILQTITEKGISKDNINRCMESFNIILRGLLLEGIEILELS